LQNGMILSMPAELIGLILSYVELHDVLNCMKAAKIFGTAMHLPVTWADADFRFIPQGKQLGFARFLVEVGAHIRHLHVHLGKREVGILCALVETCGARLRSVDFRVLKQPYCLQLPPTRAVIIDLDAPGPPPVFHDSVPLVLRKAGLSTASSWVPAICTALESCRNIDSLTLGTPKASHSDPPIRMWSQHPCLTSVRMLDSHFPDAASVHAAIAVLPALEHLAVNVAHGECLELEHANLRIMDMRLSDKGGNITRINCPKLERLLCPMHAGYGCGVVIINPYTQRVYSDHPSSDQRIPSYVNETRFVEFAPWSETFRQTPSGTRLELPADCQVSWTHPPFFVCPSTPMHSLHRELQTIDRINKLEWGQGAAGLPSDMVKRFRTEAIAHFQTSRFLRNGRVLVPYIGGVLPEDDLRRANGHGY
jgi:hypothetical protein